MTVTRYRFPTHGDIISYDKTKIEQAVPLEILDFIRVTKPHRFDTKLTDAEERNNE